MKAFIVQLFVPRICNVTPVCCSVVHSSVWSFIGGRRTHKQEIFNPKLTMKNLQSSICHMKNLLSNSLLKNSFFSSRTCYQAD